MQPTAMMARINDMARKGEMHNAELALIAVSLMREIIVHFHLLFFRMKMATTLKTKSTTNGLVSHQFHSRRDHVPILTSFLEEEEGQLQEDLNSARAKLGAAANLH
jgi:hypothetical protein